MSDANKCCEGQCSGGASNKPDVVTVVREGYAEVSRSTATRTEQQKAEADAVAAGMGYSAEELAAVPAEANMGLQCGNPTRLAGLKEGEVVVDLGSGGGIDVFLAAKMVGTTGRAIGIDMTTEMVEQARASAAKAGLANVEFIQAEITQIPLPDNSVDCLISNCVINLAPNKMDVFKEMFRVLKPGGRVAVSDVVLTDKPMPPEVKGSVTMLIGCVAGAISVGEYVEGLTKVGFQEAQVTPGEQDLNAMWRPENRNGGGGSSCVTCCGVACTDLPISQQQFDINQYVFSGKVTATKPSA